MKPETVMGHIPPPCTPLHRSANTVLRCVWKLAQAAALLLLTLLMMFLAADIPDVARYALVVPVGLAGLVFGWQGGLVAALIGAGLLAPALDPGVASPSLGWAEWVLTGTFQVVVGVMAGIFVARGSGQLQRAEQRIGHLSRLYARALARLAETVEMRSEHATGQATGQATGHSERVAHNACVLGRAAGLTKPQLETLYWAGLLHDLGKIAVPEATLLKPGRLTVAEFAAVKGHPAHGANLLMAVSGDLEAVAMVVRSHHERWDGCGYPDGLATTCIPRLARIITIVDVFEALTNQRPYRQAEPPGQALAYLHQHAGAHFDPELVALFDRCWQQGEISISEPPVNVGSKLTLVSCD